jgi:hypothetical protein
MKNVPSLWLRSALLVAALGVGIGCAKPPNDAQVTSAIQTKLGTDSGLQNKRLTVQAANGTVTLSGTVDNDAQREAAARYAASAPGVKQVINNLQVGSASAESAPAPAAAEEPPTKAPAKEKKPSPVARTNYRKADQQADWRDRRGSGEQTKSSAPPAEQSASVAAPVGDGLPAQTAPQTVAAPPPAVEPQEVTIPSGASLAVRLVDTIDSATAQTGDTFHATLDVPVAVDGDVVIPAHYDVDGQIVNAQSSGKFAGKALLDLQLNRIKVGDRWYNIQTDHFKQETGSRGKNTAEKVGGGAVVGAILGGIFGGGKGAAIGSVAGAGAGGGVQAASKKPDIKLSSEKIMTFTLQAPVTIVPTTKPAREGKKLDSNPQQ